MLRRLRRLLRPDRPSRPPPPPEDPVAVLGRRLPRDVTAAVLTMTFDMMMIDKALNMAWHDVYAGVGDFLAERGFTRFSSAVGEVYVGGPGVDEAACRAALGDLAGSLDWFDRAVAKVRLYRFVDGRCVSRATLAPLPATGD